MSVKLKAQDLKNQNVNVEGEGVGTDATAGTGAEAGAGAGTGTAGKGKGKNSKFDEFKAQGASIRAKKTEADLQAEGAHSGDVQFVIALGNPARVIKRTEKGEKIGSMECVGYRFKALKPVTVPKVKLLADAKNNPMLFDPETVEYVEVAEGQEFDLLLPELGQMISDPKYAGTFNGGGDTVQLHVTISASRNYVPLSVLKRPGTVLKDHMLPVGEKKLVDGKERWCALPEFEEKFGYLYKVVQTNRGTGSSKSKNTGEATKDLAAALRNYFSNRK
jgi:hypothetical protein